MHACNVGSSGKVPSARSHTCCPSAGRPLRLNGSLPTWRRSIGRGRSYHSPIRSLYGAMRVLKSANDSGAGTSSGIGTW